MIGQTISHYRITADTETQPVIRVVQNWYEEFRDREQD